ncbi:nitric oxide-associated protein 1 [Alosa sapidissima]|uniref:nitric oxide-associated protein 1 n=1 Tax=Alosa sapidissima TaxID=34773 RepID=UPI001C08B776|nr:nitric oxide-associated protein 1 [Alosa sapidissima]
MYKLLQLSLWQMRSLRRFCMVRRSFSGRVKWSASLSPSLQPQQYVSTSAATSLQWTALCLRSEKNGISNSRCYPTGRGEKAITAEPDNEGTVRLAFVDPDREEEFVFLEQDESEDLGDSLPNHLRITDTMITKDKAPVKSDSDSPRGALEQQARALAGLKVKADESLIEFHDVGFLVEEISKSRQKRRKEQKVYGSPDPDQPASDTPCSGCGALMHCADPDIPGYIASEKYARLVDEGALSKATCQRCYLLTNHQKALNVTMSKEEYRDIVRTIKPQKALVLLIVDLLDLPDSIVPDLPELVGRNKHILILGNKVDLLPGDSQNYLSRIKKRLVQYCAEAGVPAGDATDIHLISAKTGYGIEKLVSRLQLLWRYKGDVYLVGTANAGKSTLFNTLLESDYCKSRASEAIRKATISPWPGTTLNLLKFPIINPTAHRVERRQERLRVASVQTLDELQPEEQHRLHKLSRHAYLVGRVGRTFRVEPRKQKELTFDPDQESYGPEVEEEEGGRANQKAATVELSYNEIKDAHWFYDTPGIMKDKDILSVLSEREVKQVVPTEAITPRTFILPPATCLFLGGLARIDYLEGTHSCWFSVLASSRIPVHVTTLEKADGIYQKHAGRELLKVPIGGEERMREFPPLVPQDFELIGEGPDTAVCDIKLSSAGWVAVTGREGDRLRLRCHAPEAAGMHLRTPPLLPHIAMVRGQRIKKSPAYKPCRPPTQLDTSLAQRKAKKRS